MDAQTAETYRAVTEAVAGWPEPAGFAVEALSEAGLVLLALLLAVAGWRARRRGARFVAVPVLGGIATLAAYATSEVVKLAVAEERPCQALDGVTTLVACPPAGDWSLPSNHATLAAALAVAVALAVPRLSALVLLLAVAVGASRVAVGVHYPHDVVDGLVLGALMVGASVLALRAPAARLIGHLGERPVLGRLLLARDD